MNRHQWEEKPGLAAAILGTSRARPGPVLRPGTLPRAPTTPPPGSQPPAAPAARRRTSQFQTLARGLCPSGSPPSPALPLASPLTLTAQPPPPVSPCTSLEGAGHPCSGPPLASPGCPCSSFAIRLTTSRRPSRTLGLGSVRSCEFPESPWLPAHLEHDCGLSGPSPLGQGCVDLPLSSP